MTNISIFDSVKPQVGEFFKFKNIGDSIQGTYIDVRNGIDSFGNAQKIYVIIDKEGKVWNLGFREKNAVIMERMANILFGQIVGFRFDEERDSKKNPGYKAKIIRIYADPKFINHEWVAQRNKIEAQFAGSGVEKVDDDKINTDMEDIFELPKTAAPAVGNLPDQGTAPGNSKNEALDAIRNLAKTKKLTSNLMTYAEADKAIEEYTKLPLIEENLTKIIIALTGFVGKGKK